MSVTSQCVNFCENVYKRDVDKSFWKELLINILKIHRSINFESGTAILVVAVLALTLGNSACNYI